jgi:hypothetical protein
MKYTISAERLEKRTREAYTEIRKRSPVESFCSMIHAAETIGTENGERMIDGARLLEDVFARFDVDMDGCDCDSFMRLIGEEISAEEKLRAL